MPMLILHFYIFATACDVLLVARVFVNLIAIAVGNACVLPVAVSVRNLQEQVV